MILPYTADEVKLKIVSQSPIKLNHPFEPQFICAIKALILVPEKMMYPRIHKDVEG